MHCPCNAASPTASHVFLFSPGKASRQAVKQQQGIHSSGRATPNVPPEDSPPTPATRHTINLLAAAAISVVLVLLSGLTLTGTVVSLVLAAPVLVLFIPILVPAGVVIALAAAGFLFSGGFGVAALWAVQWVYNYVTGKGRSGANLLEQEHKKQPSGSDWLGSARTKVARIARDVEEWGKELGPKTREITSRAAAVAS